MSANNFNIQGLTHEQVLDAREKYGLTSWIIKKKTGLLML